MLQTPGDSRPAGLASADIPLLQGLGLTDYEQNELFWPVHPANRPENGYPVDFTWADVSLRNERALAHPPCAGTAPR